MIFCNIYDADVNNIQNMDNSENTGTAKITELSTYSQFNQSTIVDESEMEQTELYAEPKFSSRPSVKADFVGMQNICYNAFVKKLIDEVPSNAIGKRLLDKYESEELVSSETLIPHSEESHLQHKEPTHQQHNYFLSFLFHNIPFFVSLLCVCKHVNN